MEHPNWSKSYTFPKWGRPWALHLASDISEDLWRESKVLGRLLSHLDHTGILYQFVERSFAMALELKARAHLRLSKNFAKEGNFHSVAGDDAVLKLHDGDSRLSFPNELSQADCFAKPEEVNVLADGKHTTTSELRCVVSTNPSKKGLQLLTRMCVAERGPKSIAVTLCWQLKLWKGKPGAKEVNEIVKKGQAAMKDLGMDPNSEYFVLCTSAALSAEALSSLPRGVVVLGPAVCDKLLEPFGAPPLATRLRLAELRANKPEQGGGQESNQS